MSATSIDVRQNRNMAAVTVQKFERLQSGRFRVKIAETHIGISELEHDGDLYTVLKRIGRGRFVMKRKEVTPCKA